MFQRIQAPREGKTITNLYVGVESECIPKPCPTFQFYRVYLNSKGQYSSVKKFVTRNLELQK